MVIPVFPTLSQQIGAGYSGRQAESLFPPRASRIPEALAARDMEPIGNIFMATE
jgi:hypothetical protein